MEELDVDESEIAHSIINLHLLTVIVKVFSYASSLTERTKCV